MITNKKLRELRLTQLQHFNYELIPMKPPYTRRKAKMIQKVILGFGRQCLISLVDGGIMVDTEPATLQQALLSARLTAECFEELPISDQKRIDKLEEMCNDLMDFKKKAIARIILLEGRNDESTKA